MVEHIPTSLQAKRRTIHGVLEELAQANPDALLLRMVGDRDYSRGEIFEKSKKVAGVLHNAGVAKGDRVAMMVTNRPEFITAWFGAVFIGAVPAPLHTSFKGDILANLIEAIDPAIPQYFDTILEMPKTVTEKVFKVALKQKGVTPTTWDRGRTRRVKDASESGKVGV